MKNTRILDIAVVGAGQGAPQKKSDFTLEGIPFIRAGSLERLLEGSCEDSLEKIKEEVAKNINLNYTLQIQ